MVFKILNQKADSNNQFNITVAELEVQFISATRHDSKAGRALCRGEMLELMVRISHIKHRHDKSKKG